jgi:adenosylcobinamide-GDP ribazoletransferase
MTPDLTQTVRATRGALGFLSRVPVGTTERDWDAFRTTPASLPLAGYLIGALVALPLLAPAPAPTLAWLFLCAVLLVTGVNHADGVADLGDAMVVHGGPAKRRAVLDDTTLGVGGILALVVVLGGLALAGLGLAAVPVRAAVAVVVVSELGAKTGMATMACLGAASHDGLGATLTRPASRRQLPLVALVALPALVASPVPLVTAGAFAAGLVATGALAWWATRTLGGVSGDVFGAANDLARVVGLHAGLWLATCCAGGVLGWTPF